MTTLKQIINDRDEKFKWSIQDEAIHRGHNYASANTLITQDLMREEGLTFHGALKNAYQEGFLHGFTHKFDDNNYEEKKDGNTL
jgi:hypothetical protein